MSLPHTRLLLALLSVAGWTACASPTKSLEAARAAEAEQGRAAAIELLDELRTKWPESPEARTAQEELSRLHYADGLDAVTKGDVAQARASFSASRSHALGEDSARSPAGVGLRVLEVTAAPFDAPDSVAMLHESADPVLQDHLSKWACTDLDPAQIDDFRPCFTTSTSTKVDFSAAPPKGADVPDLSEVSNRYDDMERACTQAERFLGRVCGADALASFQAATADRRTGFKAAIGTESQTWVADFDKEWASAARRLKTLAKACEADKRSTVRAIQRRFGADEFRAKLVWHESAKNKSRAAFEVSDGIRQSYTQYVAYTLAVVKGPTGWTTPSCRDSDAVVDFLKRLWDECASPSYKPDQSWITEATFPSCPFPGERLR